MLNYIRAELWKVSRRRYPFVLTGILLLGAWLFAMTVWIPAGGGRVARMAVILEDLLPFGLLMALAMGDMVFNEQYKHGTLKNEITFGAPRERIYFGKAFSALLLGVLCAAIVVGCFLALALCLPGREAWPEAAGPLGDVLFQVFCALPLWIGALGLVNALYFQIKSGAGVAFAYIMILIWGASIPELIALNVEPLGAASRAIEEIRLCFLVEPFVRLESMAGNPGYLLRCWAVGMGWFWGSSAAGLLLFRRRTIA